MSSVEYPFDESYNEQDDEFQNVAHDPAVHLKFRGMVIASQTPSVHSFNEFSAENNFSDGLYEKSDGGIKESLASSQVESVFPTITHGLPNSRFVLVQQDQKEIVQDLNKFFSSYTQFDFSYYPKEFLWRCKYLEGACCVEADIQLYSDKRDGSSCVSIRKTKCDTICPAYSEFYTTFKASFGTEEPRKKVRKAVPCLSALPTGMLAPVTNEEFLVAVEPLFSMARFPCVESRLEATKMLCDVSKKDLQYLELPEFKKLVVPLLEELVHDEFDDVRQHAIMAISGFASIASYTESLIASGILPALFQLLEDSPDSTTSYYTAKIRRTAAAMLASLSRANPLSVRVQLQQQHCCDVEGWMQRVHMLSDNRTREYAIVAKEHLEGVSVTDMLNTGGNDNQDIHFHASLIR